MNAAALSFYAAIAVPPLLVFAWFSAGLLAGRDLVQRLTERLADLTPPALGLQDAVAALGSVGAGVGVPSIVAVFLISSTYGEGLVRSFDRLADRDRGAKALRGRLLAIPFLLLYPPLVLTQLVVTSWLPEPATMATGGGRVLRFYIAFWAGWIASTALLAVLYRVFSPVRLRPAALLGAAAATGSMLAGMTLGWSLLLELGAAGRLPLGDQPVLGPLFLGGIYLFLVQTVLLVGFVGALVASGEQAGGS